MMVNHVLNQMPQCNNSGAMLVPNLRRPTNDNTTNHQRGTGISQKANCYEGGNQGHCKRDCPERKNRRRLEDNPEREAGLRTYQLFKTFWNDGTLSIAPSEIKELAEQLKDLSDKRLHKTQFPHLGSSWCSLSRSGDIIYIELRVCLFTDHTSLQTILYQKRYEHEATRWLELLSDYDCDIRYHPGKANVVADALSRKEREPPLRVRALVMTISLDLPQTDLKCQTEAHKPEKH
ncbi:hypothetical protein Tco_0533780 [Tanacetum coccineum]